MKISYETKQSLKNVRTVQGGCWAECCTYHYNTASNGSY